MPPADRPARAKFVALGCLVAVWVAFVYPLFGGKVHFPTDFQTLFFGAPGSAPRITSNQVDSDAYLAEYPWHAYLGRQLAAGHLPLWDPSRFAGVPFAADISVGTFYPPNWLFGTWLVCRKRVNLSPGACSGGKPRNNRRGSRAERRATHFAPVRP